MIWEKDEIDAALVKQLAEKYKFNLITASIFARRQITKPAEIGFFLEKDLRFLHNPFLLEGMEEAVDRINLAVEQQEKILLFGDRDVDGITSTVMLTEYLQERGAAVEWLLPVGDENYGLTAAVIEKARQTGINLLITLDCGISNFDEIEMANAAGIDTIIVDHHNPHDYLPDALAVINPKLDESEYPFKHLCGCAVTCKLIWALHFSKTKYYNRPLCLLNLRPANESYIVEALLLVNLVEQERLTDNIVPGMLKLENTRLAEFTEGSEIFVFGKENQENLLLKIFQTTGNLQLVDVMPAIEKSFPALKGKSLLKIRDLSKLMQYSPRPVQEIDMFKELIISYIYKTEPALTNAIMDKMPLVALGTLADIMPLVNENRIFVKTGLEALSKSGCAGLKQLLIKLELYGKKLVSKDVGWNIAPVINASGRMGKPDLAARLLLSGDPAETESLADCLVELNEQRKDLGETIWQQMIPQARDSFEKTGNKLVLIHGNTIHRGVTGIIAARLVKFFKAPALVIAELENKATGSLRTTPALNAKDFLQNFADLLSDYGGHDKAAGFSLPNESLDEFIRQFYQTAAALQLDTQTAEKVMIDAEIPLSYLTADLWQVVEMMEPYGEAYPPLHFLSRGLKIINLDLIGKKGSDHVRLLLDTGKTKWPAILWNGAERAGRDFGLHDTVDLVYQVDKNFFQNTETMRLTIIDIRKSIPV